MLTENEIGPRGIEVEHEAFLIVLVGRVSVVGIKHSLRNPAPHNVLDVVGLGRNSNKNVNNT